MPKMLSRRTTPGALLPSDLLPTTRTSAEPLVVWRTWLVVPEAHRGSETLPLLTGLFGFPWRTAHLDAKCTIQDRAMAGGPVGVRTIDRHHRLVPDPDCTCGIYASRATLGDPPPGLVPRGAPVVTGFVELSGHILETEDHHRAQHARIVGPLHLAPGRVPLSARLPGRVLAPPAIVTERTSYRTRWTRGITGEPYEAWRRRIGRLLAHRYAVPVEPDG